MSDNTTHSDSSSFRHIEVGTDGDDTPAVLHTSFDGGSDSIVVAIVEAVATVTGEDPIDMPPLFDTINPEALNRLVAPSTPRDQHVEISFEYQDCQITVSSRGDTVVVPDR
ncbi:HalOD1 output domain-containing protein [Halopiger xanaduensis]|uniref:Halobacterial output domain-containing protein n=1 Tax=Halopiger xanaduensis (strain DSM 18323 / JCM 14033 / SH-6) TaxID=797210 RepID=F8D621_HALXS|nr:HalOD1 output domain-containing protein [Halopiger xanaduensis]AEH38881.1 hypothetical protein Halxa_4279 [Halopiger xanaduensis SH-6]